MFQEDSTNHCNSHIEMALPIRSSPSLGTLSKVSDTAAPETKTSHFESLPPEIRNMIFELLLPPAESRMKCRKGDYEPGCQFGCILHTANHALLRVNRNMRRAASAFFYSNILLILIDWNLTGIMDVNHIAIPSGVAYKIVRKGAPLPPNILHVQHTCLGQNTNPGRTSMVVAAGDFQEICSRQRNWFAACTLYSVTSLPKTGYSLDKLRNLISSSFLRMQRSHSEGSRTKHSHTMEVVDCTGLFERSVPLSIRDSEMNGGDSTTLGNRSEDNDSDALGSGTETSSGENNYEEDSDEGGFKEDDSDKAEGDGEESDQSGDSDEEQLAIC